MAPDAASSWLENRLAVHRSWPPRTRGTFATAGGGTAPTAARRRPQAPSPPLSVTHLSTKLCWIAEMAFAGRLRD